MRVVKSVGSDEETYSEIDLGIAGLPKALKDDIIQATGEMLIQEVLSAMDSAKSPVSGETFPALSREYKKRKISLGGSGVPDLELEGDLKNSLTFQPTDNGLRIGFFDSEAAKADGHLKFSGRDNNTPKRRFLPAEDQSFKRDITSEVETLIDDRIASTFSESDFGGVQSSQDLYDVFRETYAGYSRADIREIVAGNNELMDLLIELDLTRYL